jgi:predicted alpha/beta hydrolase family esterase
VTVTVLFIQGAGDMHEPDGSIHLARHLERELGDGYRVVAPEMPDADGDPRYEPWKAAIEAELAAIDGPVVIVGHSLGGSTALKLLSESEGPAAVRALFLASMPWWGPDGWDYAEFAVGDDVAAGLPDIPIYLYRSVDDPHVPADHLDRYAARLPHATARRIPGADHSFVHGLPEMVRDIQAVRV